MRAALVLLFTAFVVFLASTCAAQLQRGTEDTPAPITITPRDPVRVQTVHDSFRVPLPLRGYFVGSMVRMNQDTMTFVLGDGQPAVVHRDLIAGIETRVSHGSRGKHALIGAGIGMVFGATLGYATYDPNPDEWIIFTRSDTTFMSMVAFGVIGALIGTAVPAGEDWNAVPLDRVELKDHD